MVQERASGAVELGVLVERQLPSRAFKVISVVEKHGPSDIRPSCTEAACTERSNLVPVFDKHIPWISSHIDDFNVGRYDIRCNLRDLVLHGDFKVVEVNGTMGFDLRMFTSGSLLRSAYLCQRWFLKRVLVGLYNIGTLRAYNPIVLTKVLATTVVNAFKCRDWEKLFALYS
jgi:hypothetical protein